MSTNLKSTNDRTLNHEYGLISYVLLSLTSKVSRYLYSVLYQPEI